MAYRLVTEKRDYSDLSAGSVLQSAPGHPAFPVRLAEELFLRSVSHLPAREPVALWDPCGGSGYLACTVGLLHRERLRSILCSDVAPAAVELAARNLALLTEAGLADRQRVLRERGIEFGKPGYQERAEAAGRLAQRLRAAGGDLPGAARVADVFDPDQLAALLPTPAPELVLTDIPYGHQTSWHQPPPGREPLPALIRSLCQVLPEHAILTVCARARRIPLPGARALERIRLGTRSAFIGRVKDLRSLDA